MKSWKRSCGWWARVCVGGGAGEVRGSGWEWAGVGGSGWEWVGVGGLLQGQRSSYLLPDLTITLHRGVICQRTQRSRTLSSTRASPRISCPVEWPKPQSAPRAEAAARFRPMVSGVRACFDEVGDCGGGMECVRHRATSFCMSEKPPQMRSALFENAPPDGRARTACARTLLPAPPSRSWRPLAQLRCVELLIGQRGWEQRH